MEPNRLDDAFRRALHRHAGANPLFVTEFMRDMQERGDLVQDEQGRWITASGVPGPGGAGELDWQRLPARVEAVVAERVERLPAAWQELLEVASVEGRTFTAEVVARVQGRDERQIVEWLRGPLSSPHRLVRARDVEPGHAQRPSRYRFRHTLFQSYVYRKLDRVERARLHEAVRAALMTVYRGQLADLSETLARHARAAGVRPQEGV
jgi:predicted ATPase